MHILFLTDNFPPEVNAPASRTFEHCREWVKAGNQVTVVTCAPNFPKGRVYDGYKNKLYQTETMEGIKVIRVWTYISANQGFVKRILDYVSYMIAAILASPTVKKPNLVVATSPLLFTAMAGYVVGRLKRVPFIFELRDLWPDSIKAVGAMDDSLVIRLFEKIEMFLYHRATRIVSVTNSFKDTLVRRGIDGDKIDVITNGVDVSRFSFREKDEQLVERYSLQGKFVAGYIGTHGMAHALETIIEVADKIRNTDHGDQFRFIFLGEGARKDIIKAKATELGLDNVIFLDSVPKEEVPRYWSLLDASIIHLKKTKVFTTVIPSKLFECMGMGIPVLHGVEGESAAIVNKHSVGLTFEPENVDALINALVRIRNDQSFYNTARENCLVAATKYDRTALANDMLRIINNVADARV